MILLAQESLNLPHHHPARINYDDDRFAACSRVWVVEVRDYQRQYETCGCWTHRKSQAGLAAFWCWTTPSLEEFRTLSLSGEHSTSRFIESETPPLAAMAVEATWQYLNKDGDVRHLCAQLAFWRLRCIVRRTGRNAPTQSIRPIAGPR
jgi:hypothetical protein